LDIGIVFYGLEFTSSTNVKEYSELDWEVNIIKLNQLGNLYDLRESESSNLRWRVKSKAIKLPTFFSALRESLQVKTKERLK
jgi:hypothetical protein